MAALTDMLVPALREAREAEAALADRCRAHLAVTPVGEYREILERRVGDARGHMYRIDERLGKLQSSGLAKTVLGSAWHLTGQAARAPFDRAMALPFTALLGRGMTTEHQLLKNVEDEFAAAAFAVAACRAAERIARQTGDSVSSDLLGAIRREDEEAMDELGSSLEQRAEAVVSAATAEDGGSGVGQAVRAWRSWLRETVERLPGADRVQGVPEGGLITESELPIPDYRRLSALTVIDRLPHLSQVDLALVDAYERSHAGRPMVLSRITDLLGPVPWPGYDTMSADEVPQTAP
jgi:bacterioferritin (cytochrome b1)